VDAEADAAEVGAETKANRDVGKNPVAAVFPLSAPP